MVQLKYCFSFLIIVVFTLTGCVSNKEKSFSYDREDMLFKYLNNQTSINTKEEFVLLLINATDCGACNPDRFQKIKTSIDYNDDIKIIYLFSKAKEELLEDITDPDAQVLFVKNVTELERHGLQYFKPHIFHIKNETIVNWNTVY